jgi:hypothetical protein
VAKKWRKRKNRLARLRRPAPGSTDEMHQALGEFLTEMGRLEFRMLTYVDSLGGLDDEPLEALFVDYAWRPFGKLIEWFETYCKHYSVLDKHKPILKDMNELLTKRNYIVHGATWSRAVNPGRRKTYRVGIEKHIVEGKAEHNVDWLDDFEHAKDGPNVFDAEQLRAVTRFVSKIIDTLEALRASVPKSDTPYQEEPSEPF